MSTSHAKTLRKARRLLDDVETTEWDEITDALESIHLDDPADLAIRGRCRLRARRFDGAIADLEAAVSGGADEPEVHFDLGGALMALANIGNLVAAGHTYHAHGAKDDPLQMTERAIASLRNAVRLLPDSATAAYILCEELERLGRYNEALSVLDTYKKFDRTGNHAIYRHLGRVYGRQGKWRESYTNYAKSVWLKPPDSESGSNPRPDKRYNQITNLRKRAVDLDPERYDSFLWLGTKLRKADWTEGAIDVMGTAALMKPSPQLYLMIGEMHASYLHLNEAIDNYKEGIRRLSGKCRPKDLAPLYDVLVTTLVKCSRASEVKQYASEAVLLGVAGLKLRIFRRAAMNQSKRSDPLWAGWISPSYLCYELRMEVDGEIISV